MSLDRPGPEVIRAVDAGARWFEKVKLTGIREIKVDGDKRIVARPRGTAALGEVLRDSLPCVRSSAAAIA